ncbi:MAG: hypothetical protein FJ276_16805 [Planctomycetes bacterium]|nr:hypothetical protein [Planctomycetota bacterium]
MSQLVRSVPYRRVLAGLALAVCLAASAPSATCAAEPLKDTTALKFIPADAAVYVSGLRLRELFDKVAASKALAKLKTMPAVQFGLAELKSQWESPSEDNPPLATFKMMLEDPANQQLLALLQDAVSHEVFLYGGSDCTAAAALLGELNAASREASLDAMAGGDFAQAQEAQTRKIVEILERQGDQLKVPTLLIGFQLSDLGPAQAQLQRLEQLVTMVLTQLQQQQPQLAGRFKREAVGAADVLTLRLDGSLVPWPLVFQNMQNVDQELLKRLAQKVSALKLVISIGVLDKYLVLSVSDDNQYLAALGQGNLLFDREELAPVRAMADRPIVQIGYGSEAFLRQVGSIDSQVDQLATMVRTGLLMAPLPPQLQQELGSDVEAMAAFIKGGMPTPGTAMAFAFLTPEGFEGYSYSWATNVPLDPTKKLDVLDHVGGNPLAFYAARGKTTPDDYEPVAKFASRVVYHAEQIVQMQLSPDQQATYEKLRGLLQPLLDRLAAATRDKLFPGFRDGQSALVVDGKSKSKQWHGALPPADQELSMLEVAAVLGVSDANLVKEAFSEYFAIAQDLLTQLHEASAGEMSDVFPQEIPVIELAKPKTRAVGAGAIYYYEMPEESGLDQQLAPNAGLTDSVMVMSLLPRFTARLITKSPLQGQGPLADCNRPLAAAWHVDVAGMIDVIEPWIGLYMQNLMVHHVGLPAGDDPLGDIGPQVKDGLQVLRCFRGVSGVTYQEGKAMVTHSQARFKDLKEPPNSLSSQY